MGLSIAQQVPLGGGKQNWARARGLEPATSCVTGRHSNQHAVHSRIVGNAYLGITSELLVTRGLNRFLIE